LSGVYIYRYWATGKRR